MEHLLDQYFDVLEFEQEAEERALWEFFGGDLELFKAVQNGL